MTTEATQKGAEAEAPKRTETDKKATLDPNPRDGRMSEISSGLRAARALEAEGEPARDLEIRDDEDEELAPQALEAAEDEGDETEEAPGLPLNQHEDGRFYAKVKVDGVEREVPYEDLVAVAQKNYAADKRLHSAALKDQELQRRETELLKRARELEQAQASTASSGKAPDGQDVDVDDIVQAIYSGDPDAARTALAKLVNSRQAPHQATDVDEIVKRTVATVETQSKQREIQSAIRDFRNEFKEIADDPRLWAAADQETLVIQAEHPEMTTREVLFKAGESIRKMVNKGAPAGDRQQRKDAAPRAVKPTGAKRKVVRDDAPRKTRKDVLSAMRESRGQASAA